MAHAVRVLARPQTSAGFALAGLRTTEVVDLAAGESRLRELLGQDDVGVILVEEALYDQLPEDLLRELGRRPLPMVVPFPGPVWGERPSAPEAYIVELLRQVIGYRVRLK